MSQQGAEKPNSPLDIHCKQTQIVIIPGNTAITLTCMPPHGPNLTHKTTQHHNFSLTITLPTDYIFRPSLPQRPPDLNQPGEKDTQLSLGEVK